MTKVLFVCLGNICRSPAAEGVFAKKITDLNLQNLIAWDSAGTSAHHSGYPADERMQEHAKRRGYPLPSISRLFVTEDFKRFDYILTMDESNFADVTSLDSKAQFTNKVIPFTEFCRVHNITKVPDPYYGGDAGFELVMDIVEDGCDGLIEFLKKEKKIK